MKPETCRSVALTGHRRAGLSADGAAWVRDTLPEVARGLAGRYGTTEAISGLALGSDTWWARAALDAGLELAAYLPCPQQADRWHPDDRAVWADLRRAASREVVHSPVYSVSALHGRNAAMLADCDALVGVHDPSVTTGGTATVLRRAHFLRRPVLHLDPVARTVRWLP